MTKLTRKHLKKYANFTKDLYAGWMSVNNASAV